MRGRVGQSLSIKKTGWIHGLCQLPNLSSRIKFLSKRITERPLMFFFKASVFIFSSAGHHNNIPRPLPSFLRCDNPGLILETVEESLPRIRKTPPVDKLNRDQGAGYVDILKQAPFGGSRGHLFCVEERSVPDFPFNHMFYVENSCLFFFFFYSNTFRSGVKKKKVGDPYLCHPASDLLYLFTKHDSL